jgi:AcrR family transcriptional regulator
MVTRREFSEVRRTQILQAAVEVIGQRGLCDTRIQDIAERSGASSALVLYYFGSKDRLLAQALAFSDERFYDETADELASADTATQKMVRLIERSCSPGSVSRRNWRDEWLLWLDMWARSARDPEVAKDRAAMDRRWRDTIAGIVREGQDAGEFARVDAEDFALRLSVMLDGLAIQVLLGDRDVTAVRMFQVCSRMASEELEFSWPSSSRVRSTTRRKPKSASAAGRSR